MELLKNISEIFISDKRVYNIPEYQRGYKWKRKHIIDLFRDIELFSGKMDVDQFYCLQNITLVKKSELYNVVDGQQRLTTIRIIVAYIQNILGESIDVQSTLKYSIRENTDKFLRENIYNGAIWQEGWNIEPKHLDQHYIIEVSREIKEQFSELKDQKRFCKIFLNNVKLIYNVVEEEEENIFANINGAKVSLDGADLMRGLLMTRSAKERFANNSSTSGNISEYRVRMGMELDHINQWFEPKRDYFKRFLMEANRNHKEFNINNKAINILYLLYYELKREEGDKLSYNFFEYGFGSDSDRCNDRWEMYRELKELFSTLISWYEDNDTYHYLGYLMARYKSKTSFSEVYSSWRNINSKSKFIEELKSRIAKNIIDYTPDNSNSKSSEKYIKEFCDDIKNIKTNWYDHEKLEDTLILLDILQSDNNKRVDFRYLVINKEDKEHILPRTPRDDSSTTKSEWRQIANCHSQAIRAKMEDILNNCKGNNLDIPTISQLKSIINKVAGINSIGNLTLLDSEINRSYGNADFAHKRTRIASDYFSKKHIRPHTLSTFMKSDIKVDKDGYIVSSLNPKATKPDFSFWTEADIERTANRIECAIREFLTKYIKNGD